MQALLESFRWVALLTACTYTYASAESFTQRCLGKICLRDPALTEQVFVKRFGPGMVMSDPQDESRHQHCFYLSAPGEWIVFTFEPNSRQRTAELVSILASKVALCSRRVSPIEDIGPLVTEGRIALGVSRRDVEKVLGTPQRVDNSEAREKAHPGIADDPTYSSRLGELVLFYGNENDILFNFLYFNASNEVISLLLADSP